jgi:hypothetical protein
MKHLSTRRSKGNNLRIESAVLDDTEPNNSDPIKEPSSTALNLDYRSPPKLVHGASAFSIKSPVSIVINTPSKLNRIADPDGPRKPFISFNY